MSAGEEMKGKEVEKEKLELKSENLFEGDKKKGWLTSTHALELLHSDRPFEFIEGNHRNVFTLQQPGVLMYSFEISFFSYFFSRIYMK